MATPTWRNVGAGSTAGSASALDSAARTFDRAFGQLQDTLAQPAELSQQNYQEAQRREQQALENTRADARLTIAENQDKRAQTRLDDELLTNAQERTFAAERNLRQQAQEKRTQTTYDRNTEAYNRNEQSRIRMEAANASIQEIVDSATGSQDLVFKVREYAQKNNLRPDEEQQLLQNVQQRDSQLFGTTEAQKLVQQEQEQNFQFQNQQFDREQTQREQTVAASLGVNPAILEMGAGNPDISAMVKDINSTSDSAHGTEMVKYFTEKLQRTPTQEELRYFAALSSGQDYNPFSDTEIDIDSWRLFGTGYKGVIDQYVKTLGVDNPEQQKKLQTFYNVKRRGQEAKAIIAQEQEQALFDLQRQQRANNKARYGGLTTNSALATTGNSKGVQQVIDELNKLTDNVVNNQAKPSGSGTQPKVKLPSYVTGNY